jgi:hypothetical protein
MMNPVRCNSGVAIIDRVGATNPAAFEMEKGRAAYQATRPLPESRVDPGPTSTSAEDLNPSLKFRSQGKVRTDNVLHD